MRQEQLVASALASVTWGFGVRVLEFRVQGRLWLALDVGLLARLRRLYACQLDSLKRLCGAFLHGSRNPVQD